MAGWPELAINASDGEAWIGRSALLRAEGEDWVPRRERPISRTRTQDQQKNAWP